MTFAGMDIASVGESPRQRVVGPSLRAIFLRPSSVEVKVFRRVSSTAQSAAWVDSEERDGFRVATVAEDERFSGLAAIQKGEVLFTQKTSRQQVVTPRFGGRFVKEEGFGVEREGLGWDCRRTRTTSRGVTMYESVSFAYSLYARRHCVPRSDVRRLPETAESIFWPAEISIAESSISGSLASSIVTELSEPAVLDNLW